LVSPTIQKTLKESFRTNPERSVSLLEQYHLKETVVESVYFQLLKLFNKMKTIFSDFFKQNTNWMNFDSPFNDHLRTNQHRSVQKKFVVKL
jgi:hypothetical protein